MREERALQFDRPFFAVDNHRVVCSAAHRTGDRSEHSVREHQRRLCGSIDPFWRPRVCERGHAHGFRSGHEPRDVYPVAGEVPEGAPSELRRPAMIVEVVQSVAEAHAHHEGSSDRALVDEAPDERPAGVMSIHECIDQAQATL
jgi:hypothetical protein